MRHKVSVSVLLFLVLALLVVPVANAQENEGTTPVPAFQGPPGARPLAMGGAFIGVADDATAAEANPAGLTILTRPEVSLHILRESTKDECPGCSADSNVHPNFASYVQPWRRGVFSVYYSSGINTTTGYAERLGDQFFTQREEVSLRKLGVAAAFRPVPLISVGASVALSRFSLRGSSDALLEVEFEDAQGNPLGPGWFEVQDTLDAEDNALTYNVGVVVNPGGRLSAGAVYKKGGRFDADLTLRDRGCLRPCTPASLSTQNLIVENSQLRVPEPDFWGAGVAVRPFQRTLLALDYGIQKSRAVSFSTKEQQIRAWRIGGEYLFATRNSNLFIPIRAGYAREENPDYNTSDFFREKANTVSVGTGVVFGPNQIDIAFSRGHTIATSADRLRANDKRQQVIVSGIRRF